MWGDRIGEEAALRVCREETGVERGGGEIEEATEREIGEEEETTGRNMLEGKL